MCPGFDIALGLRSNLPYALMLLQVLFSQPAAHGRLVAPVSRSSFPTPPASHTLDCIQMRMSLRSLVVLFFCRCRFAPLVFPPLLLMSLRSACCLSPQPPPQPPPPALPCSGSGRCGVRGVWAARPGRVGFVPGAVGRRSSSLPASLKGRSLCVCGGAVVWPRVLQQSGGALRLSPGESLRSAVVGPGALGVPRARACPIILAELDRVAGVAGDDRAPRSRRQRG